MEYHYLLNGKSLTIDEDRCSGCGVCLEVCPHAVFAFRESERGAKRPEIRNRERCMECGACAVNCQRKAIAVNRGVGCAAAIIGSMRKRSKGGATCGCDGVTCC